MAKQPTKTVTVVPRAATKDSLTWNSCYLISITSHAVIPPEAGRMRAEITTTTATATATAAAVVVVF